jgi:hypothetical protein
MSLFAHRVAKDTPYFRKLKQGGPADGELAKGSKVTLILYFPRLRHTFRRCGRSFKIPFAVEETA